MTVKFSETRDTVITERLRRIIKSLPPMCSSFFLSIENTTTPLTRYGYALDLRTFFKYLNTCEPLLKDREIISISPDDLDKLDYECLERFLSHVEHYSDSSDSRSRANRAKAKARKLSTLRALFKFLYNRDKISANIASKVELPKINEQPIIRLEPNEAADLLDSVENGNALTKVQRRYAEKTNLRDLAIVALFLGTGIRISELVGLDLDDLDMENSAFRITRKGGDQVILYFGQEVESALIDYLEQRNEAEPLSGHERALFLSLQNKRMTARAIQNMVKKFSRAAVPLKKISPHKLRSTFGTSLYEQTGDIYLVADVLGHRDVNTTKKHYAAQSDANRRRAARVITLRNEE